MFAISDGKLFSQAPWVRPSDYQVLSFDWPEKGKIEFVNYSTCYRDDLELVLKDLTCTIQAGEKVSSSYMFECKNNNIKKKK